MIRCDTDGKRYALLWLRLLSLRPRGKLPHEGSMPSTTSWPPANTIPCIPVCVRQGQPSAIQALSQMLLDHPMARHGMGCNAYTTKATSRNTHHTHPAGRTHVQGSASSSTCACPRYRYSLVFGVCARTLIGVVRRRSCACAQVPRGRRLRPQCNQHCEGRGRAVLQPLPWVVLGKMHNATRLDVTPRQVVVGG